MGAVTFRLTQYADSLTAQSAEYFLTCYHADEWHADPGVMHCNSQGTVLKIAFWLLKEYDHYANYKKVLECLKRCRTFTAAHMRR